MDVFDLKRKQPKMAVIAAAITIALGSSALAQQPPRENANRPQTDQSTQIARSDTGMQTLDQFLQSKSLRVSKLVGMELQTRSGDNLGEVKDLLRGAAPGQKMQLIVKTGGIGSDEKLIAMPFDDVQINAKGDELYTSRTKEQLASAPAVQLEARTPGATPAQRGAADANRDAADRGAGPQPGAGEPRATQPAAPGAGQRPAATASTASSQQRIGDLPGADVVGSGGDKVGEVDDIVISTAGADSMRAVLQVGGVAGIGEKRISVPLSQVTVERSGNDNEPTLRVAMDVDSLRRLPEYKYEEQTSAL